MIGNDLLRRALLLSLAVLGGAIVILASPNAQSGTGVGDAPARVSGESLACETLQPGTYQRRFRAQHEEQCIIVKARQGELVYVMATFDQSTVDVNLRVYLGPNASTDPGRERGYSNCDVQWGCAEGRETLAAYGFKVKPAQWKFIANGAFTGDVGRYTLKVKRMKFGPNVECKGSNTFCRTRLPMPVSYPGSPFFHNDGFNNSQNLGSIPQYRWGHRRALEGMFYALSETRTNYSNRPSLGMVDIGGYTPFVPGKELGNPRHPDGTHRGNDFDIAYYQRGSKNNAGVPGSISYERNAYFISKLIESPLLRIILVDDSFGPGIEAAARRMFDDETADRIDRFVCYFEPHHENHIHVSFLFTSEFQRGCNPND